MSWHHWMGAYSIMIGIVIFTIIPNKPWWLWLTLLGFIAFGLAMGLFPGKEDKYVDKKEDA